MVLIIFILTFLTFQIKCMKILLYGNIYDVPILPNFNIDKCGNKNNFTFTRDKNTINFDIIFIHFLEHDSFWKIYKRFNIKQKKIMIIYVLVTISIILGTATSCVE